MEEDTREEEEASNPRRRRIRGEVSLMNENAQQPDKDVRSSFRSARRWPSAI
jgi:hypothetical protein